MQELRVIFLIIHIVAAGVLIAQVPVAFYFRRALGRAEGTPSELTLMATMGQMLGSMGSIGGIVVLLSGLGLTWTWQAGVLGLGAPTPLWLLIKQVVYIIILGLVMFVLEPASRRAGGVLMAAAQAGGPVTAEVRETFVSSERISILINLLTLVNIVLAVWKPT